MNSNLSFCSLKLLTLRRVSQYVDWMVGDTFDEGKKDLVKRLVKSYLPPIPTEYRHSPVFSYLEIYIADWFGPEEDDGIRTIRLRQDSDLGRGDSFWVTCHLNGDVPGGCIRDFLDGSAADSGIARVKAVSLANPTRRMREEPQEKPQGTAFRVEVDKIIPMEQLCLYFTARKPQLLWVANVSNLWYSFDSVDFQSSHNNTVVRLDCVEHVDDLDLHAYRLYKQVDGTWYGYWVSIFYDDWFHFGNGDLEVLQENQVEYILEYFREVDGGRRAAYEIFFDRLQNKELDEEE